VDSPTSRHTGGLGSGGPLLLQRPAACYSRGRWPPEHTLGFSHAARLLDPAAGPGAWATWSGGRFDEPRRRPQVQDQMEPKLLKGVEDERPDLETSLHPEPAAEPSGWMEEPAAEPGGRHSACAPFCAVVVVIAARAVRRTKKTSLHRWLDAAKADALAAQESADMRRRRRSGSKTRSRGRQPPSASVELQAVMEAARSHHLHTRMASTFAAWKSLAASIKARRAVNTFCSQYRMKVLATWAFARLRRYSHTRAAARDKSERALHGWLANRSESRQEAIVEAWRRYAARGALHRRCEQALLRWVSSSRLRLCVRGWRANVWQSNKLRRHLGVRALRSAGVFWRAWWARVAVTRRACAMAERMSTFRARGAVRCWWHLQVAKSAYSWKLAMGAMKRWHQDFALTRVASKVQKRHCTLQLQVSLRAWNCAMELFRRGEQLFRRIQDLRVQSWLHRWGVTFRAWRQHSRRLAAEAMAAWRAGVDRRSRAREWLVTHQKIGLGDHAKRGRALSWWAIWAFRRRRLSRQQRVAGGEKKKRAAALLWWAKWASRRRRLEKQRSAAESAIMAKWRTQESSRTLWRWCGWARSKAAHRAQSKQAVAALRPIVAAIRWEHAHDTYEHWAAWAKSAKSRRARRGQRRACASTALEAGDTPWRAVGAPSWAGVGGLPERQGIFVLADTHQAALVEGGGARSRSSSCGSTSRIAGRWGASANSSPAGPRRTCGWVQCLDRPIDSLQDVAAGGGKHMLCDDAPWSCPRTARWRGEPRQSAGGVLADVSGCWAASSSSFAPFTLSSGASVAAQLRDAASQSSLMSPEPPGASHQMPAFRACRRGHAGRCCARWLRWTIAIWLRAVAVPPWLQWAFSLWCGAALRAELQGLRWFSMAVACRSVRQVQLRRLRRIFVLWRSVCREAVMALKKNATAAAAIGKRARPEPTRKLPGGSAIAARRAKGIAEYAWQGLKQQLSVFVAWAGAVERAAAMRSAVAMPSPFEVEHLLCAFSAWVMQACLRGRLRGTSGGSRRPSAGCSGGADRRAGSSGLSRAAASSIKPAAPAQRQLLDGSRTRCLSVG